MALSLFLALSVPGTAGAAGNFFVYNLANYDWCDVTLGFTDGSNQQKKIFRNNVGQWLETGKCLQSVAGTCGSLNGNATRVKDLNGQNLCEKASYHIEKVFANYHYQFLFVKQP